MTTSTIIFTVLTIVSGYILNIVALKPMINLVDTFIENTKSFLFKLYKRVSVIFLFIPFMLDLLWLVSLIVLLFLSLLELIKVKLTILSIYIKKLWK